MWPFSFVLAKFQCHNKHWIQVIFATTKSIHFLNGSSRPEVLCKKGVLRNFTKFTGKHLCQSLYFLKLQQRIWHRCFYVNFMRFLRTPFFKEHLWWLLLSESFGQKSLETGIDFRNVRSSHPRCFVQIGILKKSQISQENTCAGVSFQ